MFVVRKQCINKNENDSLQTKSLKNKGVRGFWKPISLPSFHFDRLFSQRTPLFINPIFFKMRKQQKEVFVPKAELNEMKAQIVQLHPEFRNVKVRRLPGYFHVMLHAKLGSQRIYLKCSASHAMEKFIAKFEEKLKMAF